MKCCGTKRRIGMQNWDWIVMFVNQEFLINILVQNIKTFEKGGSIKLWYWFHWQCEWSEWLTGLCLNDRLTDHNAGKLARGELGQCFLPCTLRDVWSYSRDQVNELLTSLQYQEESVNVCHVLRMADIFAGFLRNLRKSLMEDCLR